MSNPLLTMDGLPSFTAIQPAHIEPAIDAVIAANRARVEELLAREHTPTWDNFCQPLEDMDERLQRVWAPVSHLNAVANSEDLRLAYNACLPKLSDYATEMGQNERLYAAYEIMAQDAGYTRLNTAQRKIIANARRDFRLSGVALPAADKARYKEIMQELSNLGAKFEENVLDATQGWHKQLASAEELAGLPATALTLAQQTAAQAGESGFRLTLDYPSYMPVITYADDRALRQEVYEAYMTRASDRGPHAGRWDNTETMSRLLALRHEAATLLGFGNYAEYSLATKMAAGTEEVMTFLNDLAERTVTAARRELHELAEFARATFAVDDLQAWDIAYYAEKLRQHRYALSQEDLKPYFPAPRVLMGLFAIVERLYGLRIQERGSVETWHADVRFFEITDQNGIVRGQFYLDLYARAHKRGGAWMADCIARKRHARDVQIPVAFLTCNFSPPLGADPALLTHTEVETLFHEFGHGLHHMLTQVDYPSVAGISGVPWDAVELPSQFMENWCWERAALDLFAAHYSSDAPLPQPLYERMLAAKNFQSAMHMVRQLEFALFDFRLHLEYDPAQGARIEELLQQVRAQVAVIKAPACNRFAHSFGHIFAGGYAAGYYSYKWAEVLSSDAYSKFEENGVFDRATGMHFMRTILEQGGTREPMELFVEFRGREPTLDALLRHNGLAA